jgi:hypothetical protein
MLFVWGNSWKSGGEDSLQIFLSTSHHFSLSQKFRLFVGGVIISSQTSNKPEKSSPGTLKNFFLWIVNYDFA